MSKRPQVLLARLGVALAAFALWWVLGSRSPRVPGSDSRVAGDQTSTIEAIGAETPELLAEPGTRSPADPTRHRSPALDAGPAFAIEGRVVDSLGRGVAGARVELRSVNDLIARGSAAATLGAATSGEDGRFGIEDVVGHRLMLDARTDRGRRGMLFLYEDVVDGLMAGVEIVLHAVRDRTGRVVDTAGTPIPGAWIQPSGIASGQFYWQLTERRSDAGGRFTLPALPDRCSVVWAWAEGFVAAKAELAPEGELEVRLERGEGFAVEARLDGEPLPGALLTCSGMADGGHWLLPSPLRTAGFDRAGKAVLHGLPEGAWALGIVGHGGRVRKPLGHRVDLDAGHPLAEVRFTATSLLPLSARLVDAEGRALPGVRLGWTEPGDGYRQRSIETGVDGGFRIPAWASEGTPRLLELGTAGLFFRQEGRARSCMAMVPPGEGQVLIAVRGPTFTGRVVDERGRPVARAEVQMFPAGGSQRDVLALATADSAGRFVLTPRWPEQPRQVRLGARFGERIGIRAGDLALNQDTRQDGIEIAIAPGAVVVGMVLDADDRPLPELALKLEAVFVPHAYLTGSSLVSTFSAADGRFRFRGLPEGRWQLGGWFGERFPVDPLPLLELEAGQQRAGLVLHFRAGLPLSGRVTDRAGRRPEDQVLVSVRHLPSPGELRQPTQSRPLRFLDGSFRLTGLAPGRWELSFSWQDMHGGKRRFFVPAARERCFVLPEPVAAGREDLAVVLPIGADGRLELDVPEALRSPDAASGAGFSLELALRGAGREARLVHLGADGNLAEPLPPGDYRWSLGHPALGRVGGEFALEPAGVERIEVFAGEALSACRVQVVDTGGEPVPGARVSLLDRAPGGVSLYEYGVDGPAWGLTTDTSGEVLLRLRERPARVHAAAPGAGVTVATWTGQDRLILVLRPGCRARFTLGPGTRGAMTRDRAWSATLRRLGATEEDRDPELDAGLPALLSGQQALELAGLRPGRYRLEALAPGEAGPADATIPGRSLVHEFVLEPGRPYERSL